MQSTTIILLLCGISAAAFYLGRGRSLVLVGGPRNGRKLHSLPGYYGYFTAIWCLLPALGLMLLWVLFEGRVITALVVSGLPDALQSLSDGELNLLVNNVQNLARGDAISGEADAVLIAASERFNELNVSSRRLLALLAFGMALLGGVYAWSRINPKLRARNRVETVIRWLLIAASSIAIFTTVGIVLSVMFEAIRFFQKVPMTEFLFGLNWSPQMAIRADQVGSSGSFGAVPLFTGTLLITEHRDVCCGSGGADDRHLSRGVLIVASSLDREATTGGARWHSNRGVRFLRGAHSRAVDTQRGRVGRYRGGIRERAWRQGW